MNAPKFTANIDVSTGELKLSGALDIYHSEEARRSISHALKDTPMRVLDLSGLTKLDTVGALLLSELQKEHADLALHALQPSYAALFDLVARSNVAPPPPHTPRCSWARSHIRMVGQNTEMVLASAKEIIAFIGQVFVSFIEIFRKPKHLRFGDIVHHIEETGIHAVPIIGLISFLIAIVLAYQSIAQLKPMGGEQYTVNLVAISVLREMGVLLTAIMVAGRSGSAFTAEIGVMKVREEVDALSVIGINPFGVLIMPRLIALLISLPLLAFIADITGLLGGGIVTLLLVHIPLPQYMERVRYATQGHDLFVGLIKAPVFAFLIAMVGCMHGMQVSGSAESVGKQTTLSVVKSIFLVLVADAIFSIVFERIGI